MALALGLFLLPMVTRADVLIQKPFDSVTSTPASLSVINALEISNSVITFAPASPPPIDTYNSAVNGAPLGSVNYFGTLDLKNNDLIIHPTVQDESHAIATFHAVYDAIHHGADGGAYDGTGITSSTVSTDAGVTGATNPKGALAIGVMLNDDGAGSNPDGSGNPLWGGAGSDLGTFDGYGASAGQSLTQYDTIVKYSFIGDLFLEGKVTQTNAAVVFGNLGKNPDNNTALTQRWQSGDEFYTAGPINQTDYAVTFGNLSTQSQYPYTATFGQVGGASIGAAVPEPASILMAALGIAGLGLFIRRGR
jgi:hypothetical protein